MNIESIRCRGEIDPCFGCYRDDMEEGNLDICSRDIDDFISGTGRDRGPVSELIALSTGDTCDRNPSHIRCHTG